MIQFSDVGISYQGRYLFRDVQFQIGSGERIGLVGPNGSGKTTILKMISGEIVPENGKIIRSRYATTGYLPQEDVIVSGKPLLNEVETAFGDVVSVKDRLNRVKGKLADTDTGSDAYPLLIEEYGILQHRYEDLDGFSVRSRCEQVLTGLGFSEADLERSSNEFSGGWRMRIALAKLLLQNPWILLLDEPTNHLDLDSLRWLEQFLQSYAGSIVLVSHDRHFLNALTQRTFEMEHGKLTVYAGNYSWYKSEKKAQAERVYAEYVNQKKRIQEIERFIERFRYKDSKAAQVQSRVKMLEKMNRIDLQQKAEKIRIRLPAPTRCGRIVAEAIDLCKSYGDETVLDTVSFQIERGDRIGFVGVNGSGKSTLSRLIAQKESFQSGTLRFGKNVQPAYFAQHHSEELNSDLTVLETLQQVAVDTSHTWLRSLLGAFLFHGDDVYKKVAVLSGGEKSRLALARILVSPVNFLVLDEPTNHLDMDSKDVLQDALSNYGGTCVITSHDRDFLDPLVNKIFELNGGRLRTFMGNCSDYIYRIEMEQQAENHKVDATGSPSAPAPSTGRAGPKTREQRRYEAEEREKRARIITPIKIKIDEIEHTIHLMETEKTDLENRLNDAQMYEDREKINKMTRRYGTLSEQLQAAIEIWEKLNLELEEAYSVLQSGTEHNDFRT